MATGEIIFLLERRTLSGGSLSDPQKHGGTIFSRTLDIQVIWFLDRAAAMNGPVWRSIDSPGFSASASVHASLSFHTQGSGCQPRLASPHTSPPSISECGAGKRVQLQVANRQTDRQCYF